MTDGAVIFPLAYQMGCRSRWLDLESLANGLFSCGLSKFSDGIFADKKVNPRRDFYVAYAEK